MKSCLRSRIFRYGLPKDVLCERQKTREGRAMGERVNIFMEPGLYFFFEFICFDSFLRSRFLFLYVTWGSISYCKYILQITQPSNTDTQKKSLYTDPVDLMDRNAPELGLNIPDPDPNLDSDPLIQITK